MRFFFRFCLGFYEIKDFWREVILVDGESVVFDYHLQYRVRVSVYPVFESIELSPLVRLRPEPLREVRFILDTHLGRLAGYLRMLGFDTIYSNDLEDETLAQIASEEKRILLTKDRGLLKRNSVTHGYCVRSTHPRDKLIEIMRRFDLYRLVTPFRRCIRCNGLLAIVKKEDIIEELLPQVREHYSEFRRCTAPRTGIPSVASFRTISAVLVDFRGHHQRKITFGRAYRARLLRL